MPTMPTSPTRPPSLLSVSDIAERLKLSTKTIRRWIERGDLPAHRLGRNVRISEQDLAGYLNKHRA
jgi:excisionase family DNA binding protein